MKTTTIAKPMKLLVITNDVVMGRRILAHLEKLNYVSTWFKNVKQVTHGGLVGIDGEGKEKVKPLSSYGLAFVDEYKAKRGVLSGASIVKSLKAKMRCVAIATARESSDRLRNAGAQFGTDQKNLVRFLTDWLPMLLAPRGRQRRRKLSK
jgi:hypothetical protein